MKINGKTLLVMLNILCPILSLYNISLTTIEMDNSIYYKILYTKHIGRPIDILICDEISGENYDIIYAKNYLYIRSNISRINITLVWDDSIGERDIIYSTDSTSLKDEYIKETYSDKIFLESTNKEDNLYDNEGRLEQDHFYIEEEIKTDKIYNKEDGRIRMFA